MSQSLGIFPEFLLLLLRIMDFVLSLCIEEKFEKLIILIHGFSDNNETFTEVYPSLQARYPQALIIAPVLRDYEKSSVAGKKDYFMYEVACDIKKWITYLVRKQDIPVHIVGHDWGAVVAYKTASMFPELITLMATALYLVKFKGDYLFYLWKFLAPTWNFSEKLLSSVKATLERSEVLDVATAYYRWDVLYDEVPTLIIGGKEDGCMLSQLFELQRRLLKWEKNAKVMLVDNAGHLMHREQPMVVSDSICAWFDNHSH
ncbi:alpha/beta-hydrolase [Metschnikowia bicuspidata]|uniref:Alpha/beta-hydrolase n=1 Tax=Metschnikowia bicuspidata TaxID=27322 RepID=A0A4P9ZBL8_9ASCO|nr:alpha/beta-hydrolase [Metschnikowia bicuspidata]